MDIKLYFVRMVRYMVRTIVILVLLFAIMMATKTSNVGSEDIINQIFNTTKGYMLIGMMILVSVIYPFIGYINRVVSGDLKLHREQILDAMRRSGYVLRFEDDQQMTFDMDSIARKVLAVGNESIVIEQLEGQQIKIQGERKGVVAAQLRLGVLESNK